MGLDDIISDPPWWWMILALILGIAEIIVPGFFLIWLAAAAAIVGILTFLFGLTVLWQAVAFAVTAVLAVYIGRDVLKRNPGVSSDPHLNDRVARLIGETVLVVEPISEGSGRVKVGDSVWSATGPETLAGAHVRIVGAKGTVLVVEAA